MKSKLIAMLLTLCCRLYSNKKGTSAVEFAIIVLPFLLLCFLCLEASRYFWNASQIQNALIKVVRESSFQQSLTTTYVVDKVKASLANLDSAKLSVTASIVKTSTTELDLTINYQFVSALPLFTNSIPIIRSTKITL